MYKNKTHMLVKNIKNLIYQKTFAATYHFAQI